MAAASIATSMYVCNSALPVLLRTKLAFSRRSSKLYSTRSESHSFTTSSVTWDDVFRIAKPHESLDDSTNLQGFFERVRACNRGSEMRNEFLPFVVDERIIGYVHDRFADHLRDFQDVFVFHRDNVLGGHVLGHITLHGSLRFPRERTDAVGDVIRSLGERVIPGIRNELYPVTSSFGAPVFFSLERAATPYFGIKAYGIHMCGYVDRDGEKFLWVGKRSNEKPTFPGMLDHLVAGGLPHDVTCKENVLKECEEEAGIPRSLANTAVPVGAVSYMDIDGYRYKRDVLFCYDLKIPDGFVPSNQDGEVESFRLIPVTHVANIIKRTQFFKPNCSLVIIDFLFRHGFISPEESGYLQLLQSLRSGDCS